MTGYLRWHMTFRGMVAGIAGTDLRFFLDIDQFMHPSFSSGVSYNWGNRDARLRRISNYFPFGDRDLFSRCSDRALCSSAT